MIGVSATVVVGTGVFWVVRRRKEEPGEEPGQAPRDRDRENA